MSTPSIDLNCDLGEYDSPSEGASDAKIMPFISSCNIACGAHAGNQPVIKQTVQWAINHQVKIGAHPAYPDRENFGRTVMRINRVDLQTSIQQQIMLVKQQAEACGGELHHIKPHGALYNQAATDASLAELIVEVVAAVDSGLLVYGLAHSELATAASKLGLGFVAEGFADRAYTATKTLLPRHLDGACIDDPKRQLQQALQLLQKGQVNTVSGESVRISVATMCLHGDHPNAVAAARTLNQGIKAAGFSIQAPS
ncbi:5-oxoprolinase subunit PxpA [Marinicella sp. S1101]|uniref:5-oxoprolinase subunit PxpA n=1 Tax=Marinicella marina TaxID=2996016 RepID=UPI0022608F65|nr:5-oxoprolinase subunit PxpA [Marinicella marina]MCX7554945.1 5-oxoprolinase subunit PxpA [Marinicella marina]MDJ1141555.1 5-oxoprolinase subunit PxpA [Marinicella marina]